MKEEAKKKMETHKRHYFLREVAHSWSNIMPLGEFEIAAYNNDNPFHSPLAFAKLLISKKQYPHKFELMTADLHVVDTLIR